MVVLVVSFGCLNSAIAAPAPEPAPAPGGRCPCCSGACPQCPRCCGCRGCRGGDCCGGCCSKRRTINTNLEDIMAGKVKI
ncbi:unnamed protein product [Schistosoma rodhaini]|nr:unnamed protein product [Schistosoma rodhaini]CAH8603247.1 unnamed protein product [Schistosoma rodhaini]